MVLSISHTVKLFFSFCGCMNAYMLLLIKWICIFYLFVHVLITFLNSISIIFVDSITTGKCTVCDILLNWSSLLFFSWTGDPAAPPDLETRAVGCSWGNKTYQIGDKMYFDDFQCQSCVCTPEFTSPTGPGCSKIDCGFEFRLVESHWISVCCLLHNVPC